MVKTEELLKSKARELDAMLLAFEGRYLHFLDLYPHGESINSIEERERACAAFYGMRDMARDFARLMNTVSGGVQEASSNIPVNLGAQQVADQRDEPKKKAGRPKKAESKPEEKAPAWTASESDLYGTASVVSTLGQVRIINTTRGCMYSASDIVSLSGPKHGHKWVRNNAIESDRFNIEVYSVPVSGKSKSGRMVGYRMNVVSKEDAKKIMDANMCPADIAEWVENKVFSFKFRNGANRIPESNLFLMKNQQLTQQMLNKGRKNEVSYHDGELHVSWA